MLLTGCSNAETQHNIQEETSLAQVTELAEVSIQEVSVPKAKEPGSITVSAVVTATEAQRADRYYGKLSVTGSRLTDSAQNPVQLRGLSSHGLAWFPEYVNAPFMQQMKTDWGCNVFRLAMYTASHGGYCTGSEEERQNLKDTIHRAVGIAEELGMYIIIDWHILTDSNPLLYKEEAVAFFGDMARQYGDKDHIIYEICNEPNGRTSWSHIREYADLVIPAIREHSDAVILVGTPMWAQAIEKPTAEPLDEYSNIMYTYHYYAATHGANDRKKLVAACQQGLPIFISEFGICGNSGDGAVDEKEADNWLRILDQYGISYVMWNVSNKAESAAIINNSCQKTEGFLVDDLSPAGQWFVGTKSRYAIDTAEIEAAAASDSPASRSVGLAAIEDTWTENGSTHYKYQAEIQNNTDTMMDTWIMTIEFNQDISLLQTWNGNFEANGRILTIKPADYNQKVTGWTNISGIGFIIESEPGLNVESVTVE